MNGSDQKIRFSALPPISEQMTLDFTHKIMALGGPVGTGKTISLGIKALSAAMWIKPMADGVRRSKFIVARRRYGDLEATIIEDFQKVIAPGIFVLTGQRSPRYGRMFFTDAKGPVECEIYFYAFETEEDLLKIKSAKFTAGFIVEAQEFPSARYVKKIAERINRYPSNENADEMDEEELETNNAIEWQLPNGAAYKNAFLAMDLNYPNRQHWMRAYFEEDNPTRPDGTKLRKLYKQPSTHIWIPGVRAIPEGQKGVMAKYRGSHGAFIRNPAALPYIIHQGWQYWEDLILENIGDDALIQQNILGDFGTIVDGAPVHPKFSPDRHVSDLVMDYIAGIPVYVGADNDRNNAWIFGQLQPPYNDLHIIHEIVNVGPEAKSIHDAIREDVLPYVTNVLYPKGVRDVIFVLDQAFYTEEGGFGNRQSDILDKAGLRNYPCPEKHATPIRKTVDDWLGANRIKINTSCRWLVEAWGGEFNFPMNRDGIVSNTPAKNLHSHPAEAGEFLVVGVDKPMARGNVGNRGARGRRGTGKQFSYL